MWSLPNSWAVAGCVGSYKRSVMLRRESRVSLAFQPICGPQAPVTLTMTAIFLSAC